MHIYACSAYSMFLKRVEFCKASIINACVDSDLGTIVLSKLSSSREVSASNTGCVPFLCVSRLSCDLDRTREPLRARELPADDEPDRPIVLSALPALLEKLRVMTDSCDIWNFMYFVEFQTLKSYHWVKSFHAESAEERLWPSVK
mmetsp:Transcript_5300/g.16220  ORF Transcript_5300/g.16220 Transcript_5300/m.16220 type:complete len:145 (-) Transcript_5300:332-766(-)